MSYSRGMGADFDIWDPGTDEVAAAAAPWTPTQRIARLGTAKASGSSSMTPRDVANVLNTMVPPPPSQPFPIIPVVIAIGVAVLLFVPREKNR